jgi:hypothetical protein
MAAGLLYVYTDPGTAVPEAEFHDWYDHEHGPARLTVPGFQSARRYQAADDLVPPWLALYDLDSPAVLGTEAYQALVADSTDREKSIMTRLADHGTLDRRVYEQMSSDGKEAADPAPVILAVAMAVPAATEDDLAAWYTDEHIPMLLAVPGWRRIRRFRLIEGSGPEYLSLHEVDGLEIFTRDDYRAAVSTPWRDRIVSTAVRRERRVFAFRNDFGGLVST